MKLKISAKFLAAAILLALAPFTLVTVAAAQDRADEVAVWAVVEAQWEKNQNDDAGWIDDMLSKDFVGWPSNSPAPRSRESVRMWDRFDAKQDESEAHELYPLAIVVHGDTAVAHYLYSSASENAAGKVEIVNGRYTDVLVRVKGSWKFLAWHGGADKSH